MRNTFQLFFILNSNVFIFKNTFEVVVWNNGGHLVSASMCLMRPPASCSHFGQAPVYKNVLTWRHVQKWMSSLLRCETVGGCSLAMGATHQAHANTLIRHPQRLRHLKSLTVLKVYIKRLLTLKTNSLLCVLVTGTILPITLQSITDIFNACTGVDIV